jgi:hypothetical protein
MTGDNSEPEGSQRFSNIHNHTAVEEDVTATAPTEFGRIQL